ncbi:uncharacterized protein EI90DRAFT_2880731, partial [Cantharellus anzutake]|uniref:uncharacterized protein n=1 Tax=Cantharellus anzutake TaxID=1750568 RepID=UPI0019074BA6
SIVANSSSQRCNAFQAIQGFCLDSTNTHRQVIEVLSHRGWSVPADSIYHMVQSVTTSLKASLKNL